MFATLLLQWFHNGEWCEIGWRASTPRSHDDLRQHGKRMAEHGGRYRLVYPPIIVGGEPEVVHEFPVTVAAAR